MKRILTLAMLLCMTACTYNITMAHTEGTASDLIDDSDTPTANVTANVPITPGI